MKKYINAVVFSALFGAAAMAAQMDVAAIIWPAYHDEPRWRELGIFGDKNGEWQNVYEAVPKFKGHDQPIVPLWGYEKEDDPVAVARQIDAALAAGINVWMYDWYWYGGRPFLEGALNNGFLKAPNNERMKFFLMWANHDVDNDWNNKVGEKHKRDVNWSADVSYDEFTKVLVPRFVNYFKKPNYYKLEGKPVFAIYQFRTFERGIGSAEKTKQALDFFRAEAKKAGFPDIFLISWTMAKCKTPCAGKEATIPQTMKFYSINAGFSYNVIFRDDPYEKWGERMLQTYDKHKATVGLYYPVVSTGWDNNPRHPADEFTAICKNKNPKDFEKNLRMAKKWVEENLPEGRQFLLINAWDEWTEGEYLQPDKTYGYGYLNAVARVFGGSGQATDGAEEKPEPQPAAVSAERGRDLSKRQGKGLYYK